MLLEGCKHQLEVTVPVTAVDEETERIVAGLRQKVRLPGFRPGKAPANLIRTRFEAEVRQDVLESLIPKHLNAEFAKEELKVVGTPNISEVHFHKGEPLRFKAEFEVAPEVQLNEYKGVTVPYRQPEVSDADIENRLNELRDQKAQFVNVDPRPVEDGDHAVVLLESLSGAEPPIQQNELMLEVGNAETLPEFTENLRGMNPGDEKEFDVVYPEDYGQERLSGKTIRFRLNLRSIRRKELPELNDEFARDLGDFQTLADLKDAVRKGILQQRESDAQQESKGKLVEKLLETHDFPIPEAFLERQMEIQVENQLRQLADNGVDPTKLKIDWAKLKEAQREKAARDVKASLLIEKVADTESIHATTDEVDREVQRLAKQEREPVAAMRKKLEKDGILRRIASHIRTEKTLNFLFENARKEAPAEPAPAEIPAAEPAS